MGSKPPHAYDTSRYTRIASGAVKGARNAGVERIATFRALSLGMRTVVIAFLVETLVGAILVLAKALPQPQLPVYQQSATSYVQLPVITLAVGALFWVVGWGIALTGALSSNWIVRFVVLGIFTYVANEMLDSGAGQYIPFIPLVALWVWALATTIIQIPRVGPTTWKGWLTPRTHAWVTTVLLAAHYGLYVMRLIVQSSTLGLPFTLVYEMADLSTLLVVVVFLSGSDWAEMSLGLSRQVSRALEKLRNPWPLALLTFAVVAALTMWYLQILGYMRGLLSPQYLIQLAVLGFIAARYLIPWLALVAVARYARIQATSIKRISGVALAILAVFFVGIAYVLPNVGSTLMYTVNDALDKPFVYDYTVYKHNAAPVYSLAYPTDWDASATQRAFGSPGIFTHFSDSNNASDVQVYVFPAMNAHGAPLTKAESWATMTTFSCGFCNTSRLSEVASYHGWEVRDMTYLFTNSFPNSATYSTTWMRSEGGLIWTITVFSSTRNQLRLETPYLLPVVDSWRPDTNAQAPVNTGLAEIIYNIAYFAPNFAVVYGILPATLSVLLGIVFVLIGRRKRNVLRVWGVFSVAFGFVAALFDLPYIIAWAGWRVPPIPIGVYHGQVVHIIGLGALTLPILQLLCALYSLAMLCWFLIRGQIRSRATFIGKLLALNLSIEGLNALVSVFQNSDSLAARFSILQVLLLLIALLWDFSTSGYALARTVRTPRLGPSRFLLFAGYSMISAVLLVFASSIPTPAGVFDTADPFWGTEGLIYLGAALVLTLFLTSRNPFAEPEKAVDPSGARAVG